MPETLADVLLDGSEEFRFSGSEAWWHVVGSPDGGKQRLTVRSDDMFRNLPIDTQIVEKRPRKKGP